MTNLTTRKSAVYIIANKKNGTLYTGSTTNLLTRIYQHKNDSIPGFTARYGCKILVYYFFFETLNDARAIEKKIKGRSRSYKIELIQSINPEWKDLYEDCFHDNGKMY